MVSAFLNAASIEEAHKDYLRHWHLPSVQARWNGRKPSLAAFRKAFGDDHTKRQNWLSRRSDPILNGKDQDDIADVLQGLVEGLESLRAEVEDHDEPEAEVEVEDLDEPAEVEQPKRVQPQNENKLPTSGLVYFYLHRAIENGDEFAIVPVRRIVASQGRAMFDDGASYKQVINKLRRSK